MHAQKFLNLSAIYLTVAALTSCASRAPLSPDGEGQSGDAVALSPTQGARESDAVGNAPAASTRFSASPGQGTSPGKAAPANPPEYVTSVTISFEQVARELGVPKDRLDEQVAALAKFVATRRTPNALCDSESDKSSEKLCTLIEAMQDDAKLTDYWKSEGSRRRVPLRPQHFEEQQKMGYARLLKSMSRESPQKIMNWAPRMLDTKACPRNLSAAALRKVENLLPQPSARYMMEKLYAHASECLKPDDDGFEMTHLRQGLLRVMWGDNSTAREALARAVQATDSSEKSRVLFWAGQLESDAKKKKALWDKIVDDYPLSFHALEVWRSREFDPYEIFAKRPTLGLARKVGGQNAEVDEALRWLEGLYIAGRTDEAQLFARWLARQFKTDITPANLLYISSLKSSRGTPLSTITFLTRQIAENPVILNQQTLNLLFPKPYFDVFDRNSPNTDTYLVLSVARQESGFNPRARSTANAQGLLQLLPGTARLVSGHRRNDLYDEETNAKLGVKYLSQLIEKTGSVELALAAYNAGPGRIPEWKERFPTKNNALFMDLIPFRETRNYVSNILRNNYWYERLYGQDAAAVGTNVARRSRNQRSAIVTELISAHRAGTDRQIASESDSDLSGAAKVR